MNYILFYPEIITYSTIAAPNPRFERNAVKLAARIAAAALLCAASPFAAALSQPMGQTVEIVNQCPHDITIRAKELFNPWRKVFNRRTLEAGGRIQETQFFCSLFSCTIKPLPNWTFSGGGQDELPYETVPLRNRPSPGHTQVVICPEQKQPAPEEER